MTITPIPVVDSFAIAGDANRFYALYANTPIIIRNCFPPRHPIRQFNLNAIQHLLGEIPIHVYGAAASTYREVPASQVFAGIRGFGEPYNVVDFYLHHTSLGTLFEVPSFLRNNWFLQPPANQDQYEKSLILSPSGAYTPFHLDSYAMQGWMFLIAGHKTWTCYHPDHLHTAFHSAQARFYDSRADSIDDFPGLSACPRWQGDIGPGDLLYFPAGWIHEVATHEISYGVGGSVLNDYQIEDHMKWWLWELDMGFQGAMDLKYVIETMPRHRFSGPAGLKRAANALALYQHANPQALTGVL
ncbi:MAG: cupin-like domain-containing protein [Bryobacteraceae bacterium]